MKTVKLLMLLCVVTLTSYSCDEIDELTEIQVNTTESVDVTTTIPEGEDSFSDSVTLSVDDQDVRDNLDRIENVTINALTYQFINVSGNEDAILSGTVSFGAGSFSFTDINPTAVEGQTFVVEDAAALNAFASSIRNGASVTVTFTGTVNNAPVSFTVRLSADMTITVDVV